MQKIYRRNILYDGFERSLFCLDVFVLPKTNIRVLRLNIDLLFHGVLALLLVLEAFVDFVIFCLFLLICFSLLLIRTDRRILWVVSK